MRIVHGVIASFMMIGSIGCEIGPRSGLGLRLPDGDVIRGEQAFYELRCNECHAIAGEDASTMDEHREVIVVLGGKVSHIETHGELVTSIINPSHSFPRPYPRAQIAQMNPSKMPSINEKMTVEELINLTAFLQSKYELEQGSVSMD